MIALTAELPCTLAADPSAACVLAFAWAVIEVLACLLMFSAVVAFILMNINSNGELSKKLNHWRGRDK